MRYISIDRLDQQVSQLIMGTAGIYPSNIDEMSPLLDEYIRLGGNIFDTAQNYGAGKSEKALGIWLSKGNKRRSDLLILTKGGHPDEQGLPRVNAEAISDDLLGSLERLQTDYIDLYLLHRDDPAVPVERIIEVLNEHIEQGLIKAIGASNWSYQRIQEANHYAKDHGLVGFSCSSPNLSLAKPIEPMWPGCVSADMNTCNWHKKTKLPLLAWSAQASGFFSGRFSPEKKDHCDMVRVYYSDNNWERYRRAKQLASQKGCQAIHIALAYVLCQPFPTGGIIGAQTIDELRSSFVATQIELTQDEIHWLSLEQNS